jgi:hypothetical protein
MAKIEPCVPAIQQLQTELAAIVIPGAKPIDPTHDPRYVKTLAAKEKAERELAELTASNETVLASIDDDIAAVQIELSGAQSAIAAQNQRTSGLRRVEELTARHKEVSALIEGLQETMFFIETFTRTKCSLLTERINSHFKLCRFELFENQMNGGIKECCNVLWHETFAPPSSGQAVQIGLDIIATLSKMLEFAPPILCDNAEGVTAFPVTDGQQIRLYVSKDDKKLRIEQGAQTVATAARNGKSKASTTPITETVSETALF